MVSFVHELSFKLVDAHDVHIIYTQVNFQNKILIQFADISKCYLVILNYTLSHKHTRVMIYQTAKAIRSWDEVFKH